MTRFAIVLAWSATGAALAVGGLASRHANAQQKAGGGAQSDSDRAKPPDSKKGSAGPKNGSTERGGPPRVRQQPTAPLEETEDETQPPAKAKLPPHLVPLNPQRTVVLDTKRKRVILQGEICLTEGPLELFACLRGTKEHEAIVTIAAEAKTVHAALVAAGADPGHPAQWGDEYKPAEGPEIAITVFWTDAEGKRHSAKAQEWVRDARTGKPMTHSWVFGGSGMHKNERTGEEYYLGEVGDLICVSNFSSAVLDLPVESSQSTAGLLFECLTERIPPRETKVQLVLRPKPQAVAKPGEAGTSKSKAEEPAQPASPIEPSE